MSYVYIIAHKGDPGPVAPVKVGISGSPVARLSSIQTGNPNRVELVHVFRMPNPALGKVAEKESHAVLNQYSMKGEWFDCDPFTALRIVGTVVRHALEEEYENPAEFQEHLLASSYVEGMAKIEEDGE